MMETNKIVAAIFAATATRSDWSSRSDFLRHHDQMLAQLEARDARPRIATADFNKLSNNDTP